MITAEQASFMGSRSLRVLRANAFAIERNPTMCVLVPYGEDCREHATRRFDVEWQVKVALLESTAYPIDLRDHRTVRE